MTRMVSVYGLTDPNTGYVRYVGCSENPVRRFKQHIANRDFGSGIKKNAWIDSLAENQVPGLVVFETVPFYEGQEAENFWIQYLRMYNMPLTNRQTPGKIFQHFEKEVPMRTVSFSLEEESYLKPHALTQKRRSKMNKELRKIVNSYLKRIKSFEPERAAS